MTIRSAHLAFWRGRISRAAPH